jgi:hypothetical protein
VSTEHYDLAARLRAASTGHVVSRSTYAPLLPVRRAVAAEVHTGPGGALTLTVTEHSTEYDADTPPTNTVRTATGHGPDALSALAALGIGCTIDLSAYAGGKVAAATVRAGSPAQPGSTRPATGDSAAEVSEPFRTLVVADAGTLSRLQRLLTSTGRGGRWDAQASVLAWWLQRAEHPGSAAVLNVVAACAARWYPGAPPAADRHLDTWRHWLNVSPAAEHGEALLALAETVAAGESLPGLEAGAQADERSWEYHLTRLTGGWDFRRHDTRTEAALGLATRCDATELFASQVLDDPLVADRARFEGSVITGRFTWLQDGEAEVVADRLVCRLRVDAVVEGWAGQGSAVGSGRGTALRATVTGTRMSSAGELVLTLTDTRVAGARGKNTGNPLAVGQNVQLRAERVSAAQQSRSRRNRRGRYTHNENFMLRPGAPSAARRDVPWDVVMAAATE